MWLQIISKLDFGRASQQGLHVKFEDEEECPSAIFSREDGTFHKVTFLDL